MSTMDQNGEPVPDEKADPGVIDMATRRPRAKRRVEAAAPASTAAEEVLRNGAEAGARLDNALSGMGDAAAEVVTAAKDYSGWLIVGAVLALLWFGGKAED